MTTFNMQARQFVTTPLLVRSIDLHPSKYQPHHHLLVLHHDSILTTNSFADRSISIHSTTIIIIIIILADLCVHTQYHPYNLFSGGAVGVGKTIISSASGLEWTVIF